MMTVNANELMSLDLPDPQQVWGPAFCTHNIAMVYGWRGVAKTRFCMKLAHTIACGGTFLGWTCPEERRVLYVEGELGLGAMRRRYRAIQAEAALSPRGSHFHVLSKDHCGYRLWNISDPRDQAKYDAKIAESGAEVIFFDNLLSCVFPLTSRDDEVTQWSRIFPWLHSLRDAGKLIVLVHHTGKSGEQLGTSTKESFLDTALLLKGPDVMRPINGCEFDLIWKKLRDVKYSDAPAMHVELLDDDEGTPRWYWKTLDDEKRQAIKSFKHLGISKRDAAKELGVSLFEIAALWGDDE